MTRQRYKRKAELSVERGLNRIIRTFGRTKRDERVEPAQNASIRPALREQRSPGKKPKRESIGRFAVMKRIPLKALILSCVAAAVVITFVSLFAYGSGSSNNTRQAMSVYDAAKKSAPQTSSAPDAASASTDQSTATAPASASLNPSAEPASSQAGSDSSETGPLGSIVFMEGMSDPLVALIQQRLMDLNYMDDVTPTELYGPLTEQAVMSFQRQAGLPMDGCTGSQTYIMLTSSDAPIYAVSLGAQGTDVEDMVYRLYELGYIDTAPDTFTEAVKTAVEEFQEMNDLSADGIIGEETKKMIYSDNAKEYDYASDDQSSSTNVTGNITQITNLSPDKLEEVLPSALNGLGQAFYDGEQQYGINSLFVLAIINYESGNGTSSLAQNQNNLGGLKAQGSYKTFSSKAECVDYMYNLLSSNYIGRGLATISAIGEVYCGGTWAEIVAENMQELIAQCDG